MRVQLRPAGDGEAFLHRLAEMDFNRFGFPAPVAAAELVRDFGATGHAAKPSLRVQRKLSDAILKATSREYVFVDEWDVAAPREAVFDAIADARSYPQWWKPVYIDVEADGQPALGKESRQHFRAGCRTTCTRAPGSSSSTRLLSWRGRSTATCAGSAGGR